MRRAVVESVGHYLPKRVVENSEFEATLDTNDYWIQSRTGIERRHFAAENETTSDMGIKAAQAALENADCKIDDVDAIILATSTADLTFPSAATMVQNGLGMRHGFAFDVQAVCAGFLYALTTANSMIASGQANRILVIGSETFSKLMDWTDRGTCVLFGDGAGAVLISAQEDETSNRGILATTLRSDGRYKDILYVDGGVSLQTTGHLRMEGKEVFRHAVEKLSTTALEAIDQAGLTTDDVDWIVPHQANKRILEGMSKRLRVPMDRVVMTVNNHGNTSAASIPLAMAIAVQDKRIKQGDIVVTGAIGGGLAWGTAVIRW
ncbi:MAG: ketoacyl-ACP synthase III [Planktomarina sp.]|jgi:3-oxoacyl-[acyl-carrier-protein] synthase-3|nr:ketoacyl-ACP synthase III [Planktomarina sp.]MDT2056471.1 beta-ketoacyl-ACP synthase III [Planktomarina sp.]MDT2072249.1 beta-ketoacyl-ACP synthase III [Planktomarina sp.]MDT2078628.1 beta-ketoacyl-ACP synthase III [Planktomarina sp.]|tara:strand:- start:1302 stop:2264 length:963 start_codon:yes stop_codon:yes gene_type:complete